MKEVEQLLRVAQKAIKAGNHTKALKAYEALTHRDPTNMRYMLKRADLLEKTGQLESASYAFQGLGQAYLSRRMLVQAAAVFKRSLRLEPESLAIRFTLADVYLGMARFADAVQQLMAAIELKDDPAEQVEIMARIVVIEPDELAYRYRLAELHEAAGNGDQAASAYAYLLEKLLGEQDVANAQEVFEQLHRLDDGGKLIKAMCEALVDDGQYAAAEWLVTAWLRHHPTDLAAMDLLSAAYNKTGKGAQNFTILLERSAVKDQGETHEVSPAFEELITRDVGFGDPERTTDFRATLQADFTATTMQLDLHEQQALVAQTADDPDATAESLEPEIEEPAELSAELLMMEAEACIRLGLAERAEEHLRALIALDPSNLRAPEMLADLLDTDDDD